MRREDIEIAICDAGLPAETAVCAIELRDGQGAPDWIELIPAGRFDPRDAREPWVNDAPDQVIAATRALGVDPVVDYDHQTDYVEKTGQAAPAAGWIKELAARAGAVWGRVEWTDRGKAALAAREYRYLSPVFNYTKSGRRVTRIMRASLTNNPALQLTALARKETSNMDEFLKQLRELLGLDDKADGTAIAAAIGDLKKATTTATALASIAKAAKLADTATADEIALAVSKAVDTANGRAEADPTKFVPRAEFDQVATALAAMQKDDAEEKATAAADGAIIGGKVTPAQRDWAVAYARKDPEGFKTFVEKAPVIVKPGSGAKKLPKAAGEALDGDELAVCRAMGLKPEDFAKTGETIAREHEEAR